eukprot:gene16343-19401_t
MSTGAHTKTYVRTYGNSSIKRVFEEGDTLSMTLEQILEYTEVELDKRSDEGLNKQWMDASTDTERSALQGPAGAESGLYPFVRISGLRVEVSMNYYNYGLERTSVERQADQTVDNSQDATVCVMEFRPYFVWTSQGHAFVDGDVRMNELVDNYNYGVLVTFHSGGVIGGFDGVLLLTALTQDDPGQVLSLYVSDGTALALQEEKAAIQIAGSDPGPDNYCNRLSSYDFIWSENWAYIFNICIAPFVGDLAQKGQQGASFFFSTVTEQTRYQRFENVQGNRSDAHCLEIFSQHDASWNIPCLDTTDEWRTNFHTRRIAHYTRGIFDELDGSNRTMCGHFMPTPAEMNAYTVFENSFSTENSENQNNIFDVISEGLAERAGLEPPLEEESPQLNLSLIFIKMQEMQKQIDALAAAREDPSRRRRRRRLQEDEACAKQGALRMPSVVNLTVHVVAPRAWRRW